MTISGRRGLAHAVLLDSEARAHLRLSGAEELRATRNNNSYVRPARVFHATERHIDRGASSRKQCRHLSLIAKARNFDTSTIARSHDDHHRDSVGNGPAPVSVERSRRHPPAQGNGLAFAGAGPADVHAGGQTRARAISAASSTRLRHRSLRRSALGSRPWPPLLAPVRRCRLLAQHRHRASGRPALRHPALGVRGGRPRHTARRYTPLRLFFGGSRFLSLLREVSWA